MPIPIIIPPHLLLLPDPATLAAVRAAATAATTSRASAAGASSLLASALAHNLWNQVPEWIREDESWQAFSSRSSANGGGGGGGERKEDDDHHVVGFVDEMASLTAVIQKLEALVVTGYDKLGSERRMGRRRHVVRRTVSRRRWMKKEKKKKKESEQRAKAGIVFDDAMRSNKNSNQKLIMMDDDDDDDDDDDGDDDGATTAIISPLEWHAALLAYWQLCNQIRERYPSWRDDMYCKQRVEGSDNHHGNDIMEQDASGEPHRHDSMQTGNNIVQEKLLDVAIIDNDENDIHANTTNIEQIENDDDPGECPNYMDNHGIINRMQPSADHDEKASEEHSVQSNSIFQDESNDDDDASENNIDESNNCEKTELNHPQQHQQQLDNDDITIPDSAMESSDTNNEYESTASDDSPIMTMQGIKELQTMFDYAVWAYEPDEELLRSLLLTGKEPVVVGQTQNYTVQDERKEGGGRPTTTADGYQLIVHRTTNYIDPDDDEEVTSNTINSSGNTSANDSIIEQETKKKKSSSTNKKNKRKPPGRVGYFVAISHVQRTVLIGIKGTSTLEELLTDCCGRAVRVNLDNDPHHHHHHPPEESGVAEDGIDGEHDDGIGYAMSDDDDDVESVVEETDIIRGDDLVSSETVKSRDDIVTENNELLNDDRTKDEDILSPALSSTSIIQSGDCEGDGLVDMVHISASNSICPSESVEVELVHGSTNNSCSMKSPCITNSSKSTTQHVSKTRTSIRKVPSDNDVLLLFSSLSTKKVDTTTTQPDIIHQSPTDEFMETHGIEMEENRSHKLRGAHEGILHCTQQLLFEISPLIEEYAVSKGYDVVCTGHSLGAGTAILLAVLIRGRYPVLTVPHTVKYNGGGAKDGDTIEQERVRAYAFAPPPVLDRASALACRHYVTSVVYNSDIIPRSSLTNLDVFLTVLEAVRSRLVEVGMNPGGGNSKIFENNGSKKPKRNVIASTIALFRKLSEGTSSDLLLDPMELQLVWEEAIAEASLGDGENDRFYWDEEFGHHLFVPGRLLMMYEPWGVNGEGRLQSSSNERSSDNKDDNSQSQLGKINTPGFHAMWTDGTDTVLKCFEVGAGSGIVTDHLTTSYHRALALLEQNICA